MNLRKQNSCIANITRFSKNSLHGSRKLVNKCLFSCIFHFLNYVIKSVLFFVDNIRGVLIIYLKRKLNYYTVVFKSKIDNPQLLKHWLSTYYKIQQSTFRWVQLFTKGRTRCARIDEEIDTKLIQNNYSIRLIHLRFPPSSFPFWLAKTY